MELAAGTRLASRYQVSGRLGRGGASFAYLARDLVEDAPRVVKLLDAGLPPRLLRDEFERLRELSHPHLVNVRAFRQLELGGDKRAFYAADLVEGGDLRDQRDPDVVRRVVCDVLDALHTLHRSGVRHGDLKPENVLVDAHGRGVLIDLGCAAPLGHGSAAPSGTPLYMAPELREGRPADERTDLYAFGVMLRELGGFDPALIARLTAAQLGARPSSAGEVLALLGDGRDVFVSTQGRAPRLVGRKAELEAARTALLRERGPRVVWVEGPPGVGRSRLLRELSHALSEEPLELLEVGGSVRAALARGLGSQGDAVQAGIEALLEQVEELAEARRGSVLVVDDAQLLEGDAKVELGWLLRALPARGQLRALVASTEPAPIEAETIRLRGLDLEAVAEWAEDVTRPEALLCATGGFPRYLERTLAALRAGRLREVELSGAELPELEHTLVLALDGLDVDARSCLAELAVTGACTRAPPEVLFERELLARRDGRVVLAREADRAAILTRLDQALVRKLHLRCARALAVRDDASAKACAIEHYARGGLPLEADKLLREAASTLRKSPRALVRRLKPEWLSAQGLVLAAELARLSGEAARGLSWLARARRSLSDNALFVEAAELYLSLGRPRRAARMLTRARIPDELRARVLVRAGRYAEAIEVAEQVVGEGRPRALEAAALAHAYLGQLEQARAKVAQVLPLQQDARARARSLALSGFVALRAGNPAEAASEYAAALALAEPEGLVDLVANALANLASARQALGSWGGALATYERALRLARALGRAGSERTARANLANLALEIGAFERARFELDALEGAGDAALRVSIALYRAELALLTGDASAALRALDRLPAELPVRERTEARIFAIRARKLRGEAQEGELRALPADDELAPDVLARKLELAAELSTDKQDVAQRVERALERVRATGDVCWEARLASTLGTLYRELAAHALASEHEARARARHERMALDLPPTLREAFWGHPRRAQRAPSPSEGRSTVSLSRVRELNRRIGALHQRDEVLAFALDSAIELSGAERGFVLLAEPRGFSVALARNMEGARVRRGDFAWSRSIAERVIRSGEPVLTVDAGSDPRFAQKASVHALQLKSVLCAPIVGKGAPLGALYLDNRLAHARFAPEDAELLLTFADQVAIALAHAELVAQLEAQKRELARDRQQIEQLARGQARTIEQLSQELSSQRAAGTRYPYDEIVAHSEAMRAVLSTLDRVVESDLGVLIQGESGTGKELIARALHQHGRRKHERFVSINCAALPEQLLESELFGHVKGAFTGAVRSREGLFVGARGGTLFLDELGELPLAMQAKLLRVLNDGEVRAVGATASQSVDVRLLCATNKDLKQCVAAGTFREDLYYRVGVVELTLPPLRERHDDILPIAESILKRRASETGSDVLELSPDAVRALLAHAWPGNVRELQNTLLRASVLAQGGVIRAQDLGLPGARRPPPLVASSREEYARKEAERLLSALEAERWNVSRVAKSLGVPRNTLYRKLARYGIQKRDA